jgi:hypothetical protein
MLIFQYIQVFFLARQLYFCLQAGVLWIQRRAERMEGMRGDIYEKFTAGVRLGEILVMVQDMRKLCGTVTTRIFY